MEIPQPKFAIDQQVKFSGDHDRLTGKVVDIKWDSTNGFTYTITSKYYDSERMEIIEGLKTCNESEIEDMTDYKGDNTPPIPTHNVNLSESVVEEKPQEEKPIEPEAPAVIEEKPTVEVIEEKPAEEVQP